MSQALQLGNDGAVLTDVRLQPAAQGTEVGMVEKDRMPTLRLMQEADN